jgi:hypothetical protein
MVRWNAGTEHVKTQRLIDSVHFTLAPVLLGQGEPQLHGLDLHALRFCVTDRKCSLTTCAGRGFVTGSQKKEATQM